MINLTNKQFYLLMAVAGLLCGLIAYLVYISNATSYLSNDPKACTNCHIMGAYYASYAHSSHAHVTTCNDCHVPHDNLVSKYFFKAKDGLYHATIFTLGKEPEVIRIKASGAAVVQENCLRCHSELTDHMHDRRVTMADSKNGNGKFCWECHREVPHGVRDSISSSPNALVPYPDSGVPSWLQKFFNNNQSKSNSSTATKESKP